MYATLVWDYPELLYTKPFTDFKLIFGYSSMIKKKYQNYDQNRWNHGFGRRSDSYIANNERALRYTDVPLMIGERARRCKEKTAEAFTYVKQIRDRAKIAGDLVPASQMHWWQKSAIREWLSLQGKTNDSMIWKKMGTASAGNNEQW
jgi:hypothetical protein